MSREERRNYERLMRNVDRGPSLPPAAKARAERNAARRAARRPPEAATRGAFTRRSWLVTVLIALAAGYLAFSVQWPNMPFAAYLGVAVAVVAFVVAVGVRLAQRRMPPPPG
jgi:Flp pilus assembly protein TadB